MKKLGAIFRLFAKARMSLAIVTALATVALIGVNVFVRSRAVEIENVSDSSASPNVPMVSALATTATFVNINPDNEGPLAGQVGFLDPCPEPCVSQHNGGRVNGIASVPGIPGFIPNTYYAASEVGGLFKSVNAGASWSHLDGHVPNLTWDIAARPGGLRVFATSFYDGRIEPLTGLQLSTDGGTTWARPELPVPSTGCDARADHPSAFGIGLRAGSSELFVGTNCGLAQSTDDGGSWTRFDPTPGDGRSNSIWDVVALPSGRTYACGDDGLLMSLTGQPGTWTSLGKPVATLGGYCSLAVSPDEPSVVYVVFGTAYFADIAVAMPEVDFYEGRLQSGRTLQVAWTKFPYPDDKDGDGVKKRRMPFVATNDRTAGFDSLDPSDGFDLWVADGSLWRIPCHAGQTPRCTTDKSKWFGSFTDHLGSFEDDAHGDSGVIVFDPLISANACPTLYSSDGGIFSNIRNNSPICHTPDFRGANVGLHAFYLRGMAGFRRPGQADEDIYMAHQDSGLYFTADGGAQTPVWTHGIGGDVFDVVADDIRTVTQSFGLQAGGPGFTNMQVKYPDIDGLPKLPSQPLWDSEAIVQVGPGRYLFTLYLPLQLPGLTIPSGVQDITNIDVNPLGVRFGGVAWPAAANKPCHIRASMGPSGPVPYVLAGRCWYGTQDIGDNSEQFDQLWTFQGGHWVRRFPGPETPGGTVAADAGFSIIAVNPANPFHIYASVLGDGAPRMMRSTDGGMNWQTDVGLTALINDGFKRPPISEAGDGIRVIPQPTLIAFDPQNPNIIVAGGRQSGVFLTSDGGQTWSLLTDPHTPGISGIPHLPQPAFAHFDHDRPGFVRIYLGTGRGVWRVDVPVTDVRLTKTDSPDPAFAGESTKYTINVRNFGPSAASGVTVRDKLPDGVTYASGPAFCAEAPAGILTCTIGELAAGGQVSFDVTVNIEPNLVYLNSGPKSIVNLAIASTDQLDLDVSNNTVSQSTLVKAKADATIVSFAAADPPAEVVIGQSVNLTLHKVITNSGPSAPVDISISRTATAPPGSTVTPLTSSETATAVAKDELRTIDENFTISCGVPGSQTFTFSNAIQLSSVADIDPVTSNNNLLTRVVVQCVVPVAINIKPKAFPNSLNVNGPATVAVLTTFLGEYGLPLAFDATRINGASVLFGLSMIVFSESGGATEVHGTGHIENSYELDEKTRDRDLDMVLHFPVVNSGLTTSSTKACVKGSFIGAGGNVYKFFGCDSVKMSP